MTTPADIVGQPPQLQATANVKAIIADSPAGTPSEVTAAGSTVVSVTQTGTGALEITGNTTGGVTVTAGASTGKVEIGAAENLLGFYGVTAVARPSSSGVTTVAELITLLITTGLIST